jgi:hypothetical protein
MSSSYAQRLKALEAEKAELKRLLSDSLFGKCSPERRRLPKVISPEANYEGVIYLMAQHEFGVKRAGGLTGISGSF